MAALPRDAKVITTDTPCVVCGYNLRTLPVNSQCPECGTAVRRALFGHDLENADERWYTRVSLGARVMVNTLRINVVLLIALFPTHAWAWMSALVLDLWAAGVTIALALAIYWITTPEPLPDPDRDLPPAPGLAILRLLTGAVGLAALAAVAYDLYRVGRPPVGPLIASGSTAPLAPLVALPTVPLAIWVYLFVARRLVRRGTSFVLEQQIALSLWGLPVLLAAVIALGAYGFTCLSIPLGGVLVLWTAYLLWAVREALP